MLRDALVGDAYAWDLGFALEDAPPIHAFAREDDATLRGYVGALELP